MGLAWLSRPAACCIAADGVRDGAAGSHETKRERDEGHFNLRLHMEDRLAIEYVLLMHGGEDQVYGVAAISGSCWHV